METLEEKELFYKKLEEKERITKIRKQIIEEQDKLVQNLEKKRKELQKLQIEKEEFIKKREEETLGRLLITLQELQKVEKELIFLKEVSIRSLEDFNEKVSKIADRITENTEKSQE